MKAESYWVTFVVDLTTNKFVPAPTSRCGCLAGLGGCSHLRAQYAMFSLLQSAAKQSRMMGHNLEQKIAVALFPPSMHNMRKLLIPFSYAFQDNNVDKELKYIKNAHATSRRFKVS